MDKTTFGKGKLYEILVEYLMLMKRGHRRSIIKFLRTSRDHLDVSRVTEMILDRPTNADRTITNHYLNKIPNLVSRLDYLTKEQIDEIVRSLKHHVNYITSKFFKKGKSVPRLLTNREKLFKSQIERDYRHKIQNSVIYLEQVIHKNKCVIGDILTDSSISLSISKSLKAFKTDLDVAQKRIKFSIWN